MATALARDTCRTFQLRIRSRFVRHVPIAGLSSHGLVLRVDRASFFVALAYSRVSALGCPVTGFGSPREIPNVFSGKDEVRR